ncbi:MAG TPA: hypothetical protein PK006_08820 [Saprospiraceae bacterium]|nr:hypothetical protein [Saprospiraceae bacterium]
MPNYRFWISVVWTIVSPQICIAQKAKIHKSNKLPSVLNETSGIISLNNGKSFWTHNDGGNPPLLIEVDPNGKILKQAKIINAQNTDWEDLHFDGKENIIIGDTGNNAQTRTGGVFYTIRKNELLTTDSIEAGIIKFEFEKLTDPNHQNKSLKIYDSEAFVYLDSALFMFSKHWDKYGLKQSIVYKIDLRSKPYRAKIIDTLYLSRGQLFKNQITSACFSQNKETIYLLTANAIIPINIQSLLEHSLHSKNIRKIKLKSFSQKEAIVQYNSNQFAITCERNKILFQKPKITHLSLKY